MTKSDSTDQSLVRQLGAEATFDQAALTIVERYMRQLRGLITSNLTSAVQQRFDPEDVAQSTWRSFFRCRDNFEIDDSLFPILAHIAKRKISRAVRRHTAEKRDVRRDFEFKGGYDVGLLMRMTEGSSAAEAMDVVHVINQLPEELQTIVVLRMDGHTYEEIAQKTGVTKRTIHRKKDIAQELLKEFLDADDG